MRLIDADALKADYGMKDDCADCEKELRGKVKSCEYEHIYTKMDFCGWIDAMPTIEERKTGKWIIDDYDEYAVCPVCGEPCATYTLGKPRDRFCKWCGTKMEETE